jgi:hypothetical protein
MTRHLALLAAILLMGCQPKPPAANVQRVQRLYEEQLDGAASRTATVMVDQRAPDADMAAWYGGLAAFRNRDMPAAHTLFIAASHSGTPALAGGGEAMLGQLATNNSDYAEALRRYERAWALLRGSDQRKAGERALAAAETAGNTLAADRWRARLSTSGSAVNDAAHPYALQAGAYRTRGAADKHAASLAKVMRRSEFAPIAVRTRRDNGGIWWLVQCGEFASRAEAVAARRSARRQDLIVARVRQ